MTGRVNLWRDPAHGDRYLGERDALPHRAEGLAALVEVLPAAPRRVLDLGTGDGQTLGRVLDARPGVTGVGIDFQPAMLARARERFGPDPSVEIIEHDLDGPLPDSLGLFDLVVSSFAIHHLAPERQHELYAEAFDRLEPGGTFANLEHVDSPTAALHGEFLAALGRTPAQDDPSNQLVAVGTLLRWLREIGFADVDCLWKWREMALLVGRKPA